MCRFGAILARNGSGELPRYQLLSRLLPPAQLLDYLVQVLYLRVLLLYLRVLLLDALIQQVDLSSQHVRTVTVVLTIVNVACRIIIPQYYTT